MDRSLGILLHHLSFVLDRQSDIFLVENYNLGFSQLKIMFALKWHEGVQQREIAAFLGQTEASVSRQLKLLVKRGLVGIRVLPENRRQHVATLTKAGEDLSARAMLGLEGLHREVFARLSEHDQLQLMNILEKLHQAACRPGRGVTCNHDGRDLWKK